MRDGHSALDFSFQLYFRNRIREWHEKSLAKWNYKCAITGEYGVEVHHLYSFINIMFETFEECNIEIKKDINYYTEEEKEVLTRKCLELHCKYGLGVCLNKDMHKQFHREYGNTSVSKEQFKEFYNKYIAKEI